MTEQTKFKVGDRVEYTSYHGTDYGNIVEVCGSIYYNDEYYNKGNIWVKWDSDGQVLHLSELDMILVEKKQTDIQLKIQQIEQQLQELKALLKD